MTERKSRFLPTAMGLMVMAFAVGFFMALFSIGKSGVLYQRALTWEIMSALLALAAWAPAILLVASALSMETSEASDGFSNAAIRVLTPALIMAVAVSLFYILAVPRIEELKNRYASQGNFFITSLKKAGEAYENKEYELAARFLADSGAIDNADTGWIDLNNKVKRELSKAAAKRHEEATALEKAQAERIAGKDAGWEEANRFYLQALKARDEGKLYDAHYLAKRSAEKYSRRPEVLRLVEETWLALEGTTLKKDSREEAEYYKKKLEGYTRFQEQDYLQAFRIFSDLLVKDADDTDVRNYLGKSTEGLSSIAFFTEEADFAFSRSDAPPLQIKASTSEGEHVTLSAGKAAISDDAVYLRDLVIETGGEEPSRLTAPFGRHHGDTLTLRAVDRKAPYRAYEPILEKGRPIQPAYAVKTPFSQHDIATVLQITGDPKDIPIDTLFLSLDDAERFGAPVPPLLAELAGRMAYPFAVVMLVLLGAGMGIRFKPVKTPSLLNAYLTSPILVALAIPPLGIASKLSDIAALALSRAVPYQIFIPTWLVFMGVCVVICLLVSARIASLKSH